MKFMVFRCEKGAKGVFDTKENKFDVGRNEAPILCAHDELVPIEELKPNPKNPNKHPDEQIALLAKIIQTQGWRAPITVSTLSGLVVRGHGRLMAAMLAGCEYVPVDFQDYKNEAEELADLVADNRLAELADMDQQMLSDIFKDIDLSGLDLDLTGYVSNDRANILQLLNENKIDLVEADKDIPAVEDALIITKPGDVWMLGGHRLICGDSTKPKTYERLMQGELAQLIITDPPYNVDYEGVAGKIMNDKMESSAFRAFLHDMYTAAAAVTKEGAAAYIFHADGEGVAFREEFMNAGFLLKQCLIWVKNAFVLGRQDYQWRHEPILYGWKSGAAHYFVDERNHSTVIDESGRPNLESMSRDELMEMLDLIYDAVDAQETSVIYCDKPLRNPDHPTMKPTSLIARLVENSSRPGWNVLDPFGGSGSTLIACEATGRKAKVVELDTKFCDVIVRRYIKVSGKRDVTLERNGKIINVAATGILD